jgi:2-iminobutanoate/2-iminopropanoate deaminase
MIRRGMLLLALLAPASAFAQDRVPVRAEGAPAGLPFTPAIRTGNLVFASGQIGIVAGSTVPVSGGIGAETRQALENLDRVFHLAGTSLANAVKCTVFLADMSDFAAMNAVYASFFPSDPPARSTVAVTALAFNARTEIECIAVMPAAR